MGADGIERTLAMERRINEAFAAVFDSAAGTKAIEYLRSITINTVAGPDQSDAALRHLEGGRYIVGIIDQRIQCGYKQRKGAGENE